MDGSLDHNHGTASSSDCRQLSESRGALRSQSSVSRPYSALALGSNSATRAAMQLANDQHGHEALEKTLQVARMNVRRVENPTPVEAVRPGPAQRRERPLTLQLDDAQNKEHIVQELRSSNDHLRNQVQQLKQLAHGG